MTQTAVFANEKGGTGKSFIEVQYAYYLHSRGLRVICIDLDHQRNTSKPLAGSGLVTVSKHTASSIMRNRTTDIEDAPFVLVQADEGLMELEGEGKAAHNVFATNFSIFIKSLEGKFDVCLCDTNPNPDIRLIAALIAANFVISPIELNQEAIDGIHMLLKHKRVGIERIQATLNPKLNFLGILPNKVEAKPFHEFNFTQLAASGYGKYLITDAKDPKKFAFIQLRSVAAEAQADRCPVWAVKVKGPDGAPLKDKDGVEVNTVKTAAREMWREIKPVFEMLAKKMNLEV